MDALRDCEALLGRVEYLAVDYHSPAGGPQRLDELLAVLTRAGYRLHIQSGGAITPFVYRPVRRGRDGVVHVFAFRG